MRGLTSPARLLHRRWPLTGIEVGNTTPVLGLRGSIADEGTGLKAEGFRVTVKNLSTRRTQFPLLPPPDEAGYRSTVVDIETGRAATVGDILEISAQSPNPFIGVKPLQYTVTAEDVKQSLIQLPELVAYEMPAETELLAQLSKPVQPGDVDTVSAGGGRFCLPDHL